jgi:hypothetical protein
MPLDLANTSPARPEKDTWRVDPGKVAAGGSIHDYYPPSPEKATEYARETGRSAPVEPAAPAAR